ncbi:uncharacterized protein LOC116995338 [Catharus ustulatus]|uniref:uncharacterized protein LOC116995338 n=1 Tax=Catharus ustulatus TaxID=91951 RepID=UPI00140DE664|nr:uncharacterized protein LOC116995338 [Catharus ustulatus]
MLPLPPRHLPGGQPRPRGRRGTGNGAYSQFSTCCLCQCFPPHTLPLLKHGSLPWGTVLLQCVFSTEDQVLPVNLLQHGLPTGSQPPLVIHLLQHRILRGLQVDLCIAVILRGLQGHSCLTMLCRGISALVPGTRPVPSSPLTLVSAELLVSHILISCLPLTASGRLFAPILNSGISEVLSPSLMDLALASSGSVLVLGGIGFLGHGGSF